MPDTLWRPVRDLGRFIAATATRKTTETRSRRVKSKKPFRPNPWRKCAVCFHRVPQRCDYCLGGRAGVVPTHPDACCPGECVRCTRCRLECPSLCPRQQHCVDRCPGECDTGEHCVDQCPGHDKEQEEAASA